MCNVRATRSHRDAEMAAVSTNAREELIFSWYLSHVTDLLVCQYLETKSISDSLRELIQGKPFYVS